MCSCDLKKDFVIRNDVRFVKKEFKSLYKRRFSDCWKICKENDLKIQESEIYQTNKKFVRIC